MAIDYSQYSEKEIKENGEDKGTNPYSNYSTPVTKPFTGLVSPQDTDNLIRLSASCYPVNPSSVAYDGFEFETENIIPSSEVSSSFYPSQNIVEFFIYDTQRTLISRDYNFTNWTITENDLTSQSGSDSGSVPTNLISVDPPTDVFDQGFSTGELTAYYNFINYELGSSITNTFYLAEISPDRTELKLKSNFISGSAIVNGYETLKNSQTSSEYFDEFYINLFSNKYEIAVNCLLEFEENGEPYILIKLYVPLPTKYSKNTELYVATKVGESKAYRVEWLEDIETFIDQANYIKGPNINIELNNLVNNSTELKSYNKLTKTNSSESLDSVLNILNQKGVTITPNYSYNTFNEFVNFSSAKERVNNFYEKVSQLQAYQADIDTLTATTASNPNVPEISSSLASLQTNITNLIENFDGYENYLYYNSSSFAYPKSGSSYPYPLKPTGSTDVLNWLGSDVENNQYYGGIILSASLYDENNQNWLYYTIPQFIVENQENNNYISFSNMVGQSFDEVWLYTKALSERYNTTNDPDSGLPLGLAANAIKGLGFETFGNNYNNQDNFIGLTGEDNGIYVPPTGSELITKYVAINNGEIINYWNINYSYLNYVEQQNEPGFPYAIDKVSKEIYKRLYHNMAYLTKKKGTISGLRQLINIWGIPNTILRINEFGGKNRDNTDDYDLWYKRYSYAYTPVANQSLASSSVRIPWQPLQRNYIAESEYIVPDGVSFRFKTTGHPSSSYAGQFYSQSLAVKKSDGIANSRCDWGIALFYEDQPSGSYSGSSFSDYYDYGKLRFYMSASVADGGVQISDDIYLPFFDGGWWSVLLQRDVHTNDNNDATTYTLFAANKQVDGWDGNSLGFSASVSMSSAAIAFNSGYGGGTYEGISYDTNASRPSMNESWNNYGTSSVDGVYLGGHLSGSTVIGEQLNKAGFIFSGSLQEYRYYSNNIAKTVFNDFVMNPESVEGNKITGSESSFDIVNFRAPLGNELEYLFTASVSTSFAIEISSSHPAITGSGGNLVITSSFTEPTNGGLTSSYEFTQYETNTLRTYSKTNVETYFLDQPAMGVRNRVSNKINIEDGDIYGNVLSRYKSIDQDYLISQSYTEDTSRLEVGFSPQDEVNDDIIATYGYGVISDAIADPRFVSSSDNYYPQLRKISLDYFKKYTEGDVWDYLRLIKYFDNSLFKAIKSYVPARTSVNTGVIVKQHLLERNRRPAIQITPNTTIAFTPETGSIDGVTSTNTGMNSSISVRNIEITSSINIESITGSAGGVVPNTSGSENFNGGGFNIIPLTQSFTGSIETISGSVPFVDQTQTEFFNGEFSGSVATVTTQSLLNNPFAPSQTADTTYEMSVTSSQGTYSETLSTNLSTYPSFSLNLMVTCSSDYDSLRRNCLDFEETFDMNLDRTTGSIYLLQSAVDDRNYFIVGMCLPNITNYPPFNFATETAEPVGLFGWDGVGSLDDLPKVPIPPTASSGLSGVILGVDSGYQLNDIAPYFKIDFSGSLNNSLHPGNEFSTSGLLGNNPSNNIISLYLGNKNIVEKIATTSNTNAPQSYPIIKYLFNDPSINGARPIRVSQAGIPTNEVFKTSIETYTTYVGTNARDTQNAINALSSPEATGDGWASSPPALGTGSLTLIGTTWTGSKGDLGTWSPAVLAFNNQSYNTDGTINENNTTLTNEPLFDFSLPAIASGTPIASDLFGLSGNTFSQNLSVVGGVISTKNQTGIGYVYNQSESRLLSGSYGLNLYELEAQQPGQFIPFNPYLPDQTEFYNSPFNPLINNATESVKNTYVMKVEYDTGATTPSNIAQIIGRTAQKATIPDSFYTQEASILPRFVGSNLQSANYNTFTPSGSFIKYLNGEISGSIYSGSNQEENSLTSPIYGGDVSYGNQAVIDVNPIYFAHFKSSKENLEYFGTYTFRIDSLIEVPNANSTGSKAPENPIVLKIDGSNKNLAEVKSTFEVDRGVAVAYNSSKFGGVDYTSLKVGDTPIFQGAIEYQTIITSEPSLGQYTLTQSFFTSSFARYYHLYKDSGGSTSITDATSGYIIQQEFGNEFISLGGISSSQYNLETGSNCLYLRGAACGISASQGTQPDGSGGSVIAPGAFFGSGLAMIHNYNQYVKRGIVATGSTVAGASTYFPGIPSGSKFNTSSADSFIYLNYSASTMDNNTNLLGYENFNQPFIIEVGDEIRCTYNLAVTNVSESSPNASEIITQDFRVTAVDPNTDYETGTGIAVRNPSGSFTVFSPPLDIKPVTASLYNYDKITVEPDPTTLSNKIPNGMISGFTVRRRINADDRVIVSQTAPTGSNGLFTPTGDGYLIPNDLSPVQKRNVLTIINQLSAKNAYKEDPPALRE